MNRKEILTNMATYLGYSYVGANELGNIKGGWWLTKYIDSIRDKVTTQKIILQTPHSYLARNTKNMDAQTIYCRVLEKLNDNNIIDNISFGADINITFKDGIVLTDNNNEEKLFWRLLSIFNLYYKLTNNERLDRE